MKRKIRWHFQFDFTDRSNFAKTEEWGESYPYSGFEAIVGGSWPTHNPNSLTPPRSRVVFLGPREISVRNFFTKSHTMIVFLRKLTQCFVRFYFGPRNDHLPERKPSFSGWCTRNSVLLIPWQTVGTFLKFSEYPSPYYPPNKGELVVAVFFFLLLQRSAGAMWAMCRSWSVFKQAFVTVDTFPFVWRGF